MSKGGGGTFIITAVTICRKLNQRERERERERENVERENVEREEN